jgi:hypothetical protein
MPPRRGSSASRSSRPAPWPPSCSDLSGTATKPSRAEACADCCPGRSQPEAGAALLTAIPAEPWIALFFPELQDPVAAVRSLRILAGTLPATFVASLLLPFFLARHREALVRNISILGLLALGVALLSARAMDAQSVAFALLCCEVSVALACLLAFFGPARIRRQADD